MIKYKPTVSNDFQKVWHAYTGCYSFEAQELLNKLLDVLSKRYNHKTKITSGFLGYAHREINGEIYFRVDVCGYDEAPKFDVDEYMKNISSVCEKIIANPLGFVSGMMGWFSKVDITVEQLTEAAELFVSIVNGKPLSQYVGKQWNPIKSQRFAILFDDLLKKWHSPHHTDEAIALRKEIERSLIEVIRSA